MASTTTVTANATPFLLPAAPIIGLPARKIVSAARPVREQPTRNQVTTAGKDDPASLPSDTGVETRVEEDQNESQKGLAEDAQKNRGKLSALRAIRSKSRGRDFSRHGGATKMFSGRQGHPLTRKGTLTLLLWYQF